MVNKVLVTVSVLCVIAVCVGIYNSMRDKAKKEYSTSGKEGQLIIFGCPSGKKVETGTILYGTNINNVVTTDTKMITFTIPKSTERLRIDNATMGGDPSPNNPKMWSATWTCS